jgi:hypothetical protein
MDDQEAMRLEGVSWVKIVSDKGKGIDPSDRNIV